jgi:hypothetical protein
MVYKRFSDYKNFNKEQKITSKNKRSLCLNHINMLTIFSTTAMVLEVMSNKGDIMVPSNNIPKGLQVSRKKSIKVLDLVVKPWMDEIVCGCHKPSSMTGYRS